MSRTLMDEIYKLQGELATANARITQLESAIARILKHCEGGNPCAGDASKPCRIHEHNIAREAMGKGDDFDSVAARNRRADEWEESDEQDAAVDYAKQMLDLIITSKGVLVDSEVDEVQRAFDCLSKAFGKPTQPGEMPKEAK